MDADKAIKAIQRAADEYGSWEISDQMIYALGIIRLGETCDHILAKYDGRNKRMERVMELLKEDAT